MRHFNANRIMMLTTVLCCMALGAADPGVAPPNASPHGYTYAEWSVLHWQWLFSMPGDAHPLFDTAPPNTNQVGKVWFLGGSFSSTEIDGDYVARVTRDVTVPAGTALFFPVLNAEQSNFELPGGLTDPQLQDAATSLMESVVSLFATVDGKAVTPVRAASGAFDLGPLPLDNLLGAPFGETTRAASDGYFVFLQPLSVGKHTLHFGGEIDLGGGVSFILDITYNVTVTPAGK
jgi:hypothetical protein